MNTGNFSGNSVLFVCTANICRSPIAAGLLKLQLQFHPLGLQPWRIDSAGTWARDGEVVAEGSLLVMRRRGIDLSQHRAKTVTRKLLREFNLILTMEAGHKEALQSEFPEVAGRVFMLSEMQGLQIPVRDPYGGPLAGYEAAAETMDRMLAKGLHRIISMLEANRVRVTS